MRYAYSNNYSNQVIDGQMCIWLQDYGFCPAKPASEFKPGEFMRWNGGTSSKVIEVKEASKAFVNVTEEYARYIDAGYDQHNRRLKKDRYVAIGSEDSYLNRRKDA